MPTTSFILTDISGTVLGQINAPSEASVTLPHLRLPTMSVTLPIWHPRAEDALSQDTLLWATRRDHLGTNRAILAGPVITVEENGTQEAQTVQLNAVGPLWKLNKRLLGTTKAGFGVGTSAAPVDIGEIMQQIIDTVNGPGYTGIRRGTNTNTNAAYLAQVWLKPAAQQIAELAASINAPEFEVAPVAHGEFLGGLPVMGQLNTAPTIGGVTREDAIFEYGTSKSNAASYSRARTLDGVMTRGWISTQGWPDATAGDLIYAERAAAITARGIYEDVAPDSGIVDPGLRAQLLDAHLDVRQAGRQTITFVPAVNARPGFQTDYNVGDYVKCRALVRGKVRFDAYFRVWGVSLTYDANGNETVELELLPQEAGV